LTQAVKCVKLYITKLNSLKVIHLDNKYLKIIILKLRYTYM